MHGSFRPWQPSLQPGFEQLPLQLHTDAALRLGRRPERRPESTAAQLFVAVMETLPDFIRARLRLLADSRLPPKRLLSILGKLAQEYKAFLLENAARRDE
jgi:hypothetical protein